MDWKADCAKGLWEEFCDLDLRFSTLHTPSGGGGFNRFAQSAGPFWFEQREDHKDGRWLVLNNFLIRLAPDKKTSDFHPEMIQKWSQHRHYQKNEVPDKLNKYSIKTNWILRKTTPKMNPIFRSRPDALKTLIFITFFFSSYARPLSRIDFLTYARSALHSALATISARRSESRLTLCSVMDVETSIRSISSTTDHQHVSSAHPLRPYVRGLRTLAGTPA